MPASSIRGELGQHLGRIRRDLLERNVGGDAREIDAADLGVAGEGQRARGELEFVFGQGFGGDGRFEIRRRIIARVEADFVSLGEIGGGRLGAGIGGAVPHPDRGVVVRLVEGFDAGAVGFAADDAVELLAGDQLAKLIGDLAVGGGGNRHDAGGGTAVLAGSAICGSAALGSLSIGIGLGGIGLGRVGGWRSRVLHWRGSPRCGLLGRVLARVSLEASFIAALAASGGIFGSVLPASVVDGV